MTAATYIASVIPLDVLGHMHTTLMHSTSFHDQEMQDVGDHAPSICVELWGAVVVAIVTHAWWITSPACRDW